MWKYHYHFRHDRNTYYVDGSLQLLSANAVCKAQKLAIFADANSNKINYLEPKNAENCMNCNGQTFKCQFIKQTTFYNCFDAIRT